MFRFVVAFHLGLVCAVLFASTLGYAATSERHVRVLNQGDYWQVEYSPGEYTYQIEYLEGDLFVSVQAFFLDENQAVVYSTTHTLVENNRMSAVRTFKAAKVVEGVTTSAVRFECGSGKARISFGPVGTIKG